MSRRFLGFTRNAAEAFWLTCDRCEETELFYGVSAEFDAMAWASAHVGEKHRDDPPTPRL